MDSNLIITIGAVTVAIIGAVAAAAVKVIDSIHKSEARKDIKTDQLIETTNKIHDLTNSSLDKVTHKLEIALVKIEGLERLISTMGISKAIEDQR